MSDDKKNPITGMGKTLQEALDNAIDKAGHSAWRMVSIDGYTGVVGRHVQVHIEITD